MCTIAHTKKAIYFAFLALLITGCSPQEKYPGAFGIYLSDETKTGDEKFRSLRGSDTVKTIDANIEGKFSVFIFDKQISNNTNSMKVYSGTFIRKFRRNDPMRGNFPAELINSWGFYKGHTTEVVGQFYPVKDHPEMVLWKPEKELKPGLYYIKISGDLVTEPRLLEPFFVKRNEVLATSLESQEFCVDYYQYFMDPTDRFYPCSQNFSE